MTPENIDNLIGACAAVAIVGIFLVYIYLLLRD